MFDHHDAPSHDALVQPRTTLSIQLRIVDNGCVLWVSGTGSRFELNKPQPERVATTVDQAVEQFRDLLTKVWPAK